MDKILKILKEISKLDMFKSYHDLLKDSNDINIYKLFHLYLVENNYIVEDDRIVLYFSGYGDSGDLNNYEILIKNNQINELFVNFEYFYQFSELINYDWYNNEGGDCAITINLHELNIYIYGTYNEVIQQEIQNEKIEYYDSI